jgi:hypothetical protein
MGTAARLAAYACALGLVLGVGWGAGHLVGPIGLAQPSGGAHHDVGVHRDAEVVESDGTGDGDAAAINGLAVAADGYGITVANPSFQPGKPGELRFTVTGQDGRAVTAFAASERDPDPLHVVVVRRDAAGFQRLEPTMDTDGSWHTPLTLPAPGVWRAFVDITPAAGPPLVLGTDLFAAGPFDPFTFPPSRVAQIGGFQLRLDGDLVPGVPSQVFLTVSRDGVGVTGLQPYLGAFGKLVVLREGDLAYVVAAAGDGIPTPPAASDRAGPAIAFTADVPSAGTYRLFVQFRVSDVMHTAEFTLSTRTS